MPALEIIAADIGGTHARFAIATLEGGRVTGLANEAVFDTAAYANLQRACSAYGAQLGRPLPRAAGIAVAGPVHSDVLRLTNFPWVIDIPALRRDLGLEELVVVNDFAAVGHAVANLDPVSFAALSGPQVPLPSDGVITVLGPGTGLGVAQVIRHRSGYEVISTEGGHVNFAPSDKIDDLILARLRALYPHVSAERVVSGPGLAHIYAALAALEARAIEPRDDKALWEAAIAGADSLAAAALERFSLCLGACAGDLALAQGASAVVIAGGIGFRLREMLPRSGFVQRFTAKGRFEAMMAAMPVKLILHPQPGLFGAAAAFAHGV